MFLECWWPKDIKRDINRRKQDKLDKWTVMKKTDWYEWKQLRNSAITNDFIYALDEKSECAYFPLKIILLISYNIFAYP